ncbi:fimbria/pilus outer membrane usher protein [Enterobacter ludwigii]|uniref:fimbria/pilus outer membrane usher protein n=1 Tax=Enterobacter ludwigii TaxID=299767 RepID=UPI00186734D6|nr:fimbria/pilus outer membrane usher protein [Enterobacter ludwigii]
MLKVSLSTSYLSGNSLICGHLGEYAGIARRLSPTCLQVLMALLGSGSLTVQAGDYFDPSLLNLGGGAQAVDLSQFEHSGGQAEGTYSVDIYANNEGMGTHKVKFVHDSEGNLQPVVSPMDLDSWGVNLKNCEALNSLPVKEPLTHPLSDYIPQSSANLDFSQMRLTVNIPQLYMKPNRDSLADPSLWQDGVPALLLNYNLSGSTYESRNDGSRNDNQGFFASLQPGINLGPWRIRNSSTYSYNQQRSDRYDVLQNEKNRMVQTQTQWTSLQTYVQRDIDVLQSQLTIGETSTGSVASQVLDGFSYRGVSLMSSDAMIPGTMNGFAPVVTGIARSNARVTVTQNGYTIYQANVAPGPFRFDDLSGSGTSGDLQVSITESDGSVHGYRLPYSSLPVMQRQGQLRYEVAAGEYYTGHGGYDATGTPGFGMLTAIYGLTSAITVYGGGIGANGYQSVALGAGLSILDYGAVSLDATHSRTSLSGNSGTLTGESYRARYSKSMMATGTTVDLTAYRYSTRNYLSFNDANDRGFDTSTGLPDWLNDRRRNSYEIRLSQTLFTDYQLWLQGHRDSYWGSDKTNTTLSAGVSGSVKKVGWSLNYSVDRMRGDGDWPENRQWTLNLSVPMSLFGSAAILQNGYASYTFSNDNTGRSTNMLSMGGSLLDDNSMNWSASQTQGNGDLSNSGSASLGYSDTWGMANLGYNYDGGGGHGVTYSASGGILAHRYGVTLARNIGDAAVLVHTGIPDVKIINGNATTDRWGNAVVTSMQAYSRNSIDIDPSSLPEGASLPTGGGQALYPTSGAVLVTDYPIRLGQQVLMNLSHNGEPVPFGAMATLKDEDADEQGSIVGEGGQVYLGGMPEKGTLLVTWGNTSDTRCEVPFRLDKPEPRKKGDKSWRPVKTVDMSCR